MAGSQDIAADARNARVKVWINGTLVPRAKAMVSVFDGGFIAGDGVWEGFRLVGGRLLFAEAHIARLFQGARAIDLGRTGEAESYFKAAITADPTSSEPYYNLALICARAKRYEEARAFYQQALERGAVPDPALEASLDKQ